MLKTKQKEYAQTKEYQLGTTPPVGTVHKLGNICCENHKPRSRVNMLTPSTNHNHKLLEFKKNRKEMLESKET